MSEQARPTPARIEIETADGRLPAYLWHPAAGSGPAVVVFQEIFGLTDYIRDRCADLAALGFVVCAPEIFWRLGADIRIEDGPDALERAMGVVTRLDWPAAVRDGVATLEHVRGLIEVTGPVGLLGFCFGGGLAFNVAAESDPDALVSYYGSSLPQLLGRVDDVSAPSLHHFGLADAYLPPDVVEELTAALSRTPTTRIETYEGAGHAFDNPNPIFHHPEASAAAWNTTTRFLLDMLSGAGRDTESS
jgi:carboxymethylenebutenolidase